MDVVHGVFAPSNEISCVNVEYAYTDKLALTVLLNCPDSNTSFSAPSGGNEAKAYGVFVPSQDMPLAYSATAKLVLIVLLNCPLCKYSFVGLIPDHGVFVPS